MHYSQCAFSADGDQRVEAMRVKGIEELLRAVALFPRSVGTLHSPFEWIAPARGAENRTAEVGDAADFVRTEGNEVRLAEQTAEATLDSEALPTAVDRGQHGRPDDGVQPRRVATADGDRNSHCLPTTASRISRTTSPGSACRLTAFLENTRCPSTSTSKTPPED